jgi:hypothetical protein
VDSNITHDILSSLIMAYQLLQGIQVIPKGAYNTARFDKTLADGNWPMSFAFGGWIYNAACEIGFSNQPTEIKLSIVLEVTDKAQKYAFFDINEKDLKCDAGDGGQENLYDIDFNGVNFSNFILYDYKISVEPQTKILTVTFKDYSLILDKIYVGLIKRQGKQYVYAANSRLEFPVICPDCMLEGNSLRQPAFAERALAYGSYVGINGKIYDNFKNIKEEGNIYRQWEALFSANPGTPSFDLNGGYLILGTEEATEERCGDLAPVSYNFNQLLASLRFRGMKFEGAFPKASKDADYFYHQNYIGSLREVLQQWCSDLGYDFYCDGKTFVGINLNKAIDIKDVVDIADPTTLMGSEFAANKNTAILSYNTSSSLNNTYKQSVITANNRARNVKIHSKSPKRYVGILPLHPIDFNRHSNTPLIRYDAFGNWFYDIAWANSFEDGSPDKIKVLSELDGRMFAEIDVSIALSRFNDGLRDIYCQDRALYGETPAIREANFKALGFVPLVELTDNEYPEAKSICIEAVSPDGNGDEVSSLCLDRRFYKVFIGYYYPKFKQDIVAWEQLAGDAMYKYGIITRGLLNHYPYMPKNSLTDISPKSGLYGNEGTSLLRIQHSVEPAANQYFVMRQAPFKDIILYSGLMTPPNLALPGIPTAPFREGVFPTGLFYSELINDWGTSKEEFDRYMSLSLDDPCVQEFSQYTSFTQMVNNIPKKFQDWRVENFTPKVSADLEKIWAEAAIALDNLPNQTIYDRTVTRYYDLHYKYSQACSKLHVMVMVDTRNHPNLYFGCLPKGTNYVNMPMLQQYFDREREAIRRRIETKTPTICDMSLIQEMCRNLLSGNFQSGPNGDSRYGCIQDEDKWNWLEEGFTYQHLTRPNSRGLQIRIIKNPIGTAANNQLQNIFKNCDVNGDFYYSDLINDFLFMKPAEMNFTIVYPVSSTVVNTTPGATIPPLPQDPGNSSSVVLGLGGYYRGILTSTVEVENRTPEIVEIFGSPVNVKNNSTASLKIINNVVDPDLQPQLDPYSMRFWAYMTVITGDAQIVTTVAKYHELVSKLNSYEMTTPMKTVELSLAGTPNNFGNFKKYLNPNYGLNHLSMSVSDNGVTTALNFADRPKHLPKQESILNKITPRMK